jgi:5-methylcytosine-specific restriction endonuclease McrA
VALATRCLDCGARTKGSRCSACQARRSAARGTTTQRGYGAAHQRRARRAIALQPWCSICGSATDLTADHITPLARGGHPLGPLRVLCRRCNSRRAQGLTSTDR